MKTEVKKDTVKKTKSESVIDKKNDRSERVERERKKEREK